MTEAENNHRPHSCRRDNAWNHSDRFEETISCKVMKGIKSEDFPKVITGIGRLELANLKDAIQEGSLRKPCKNH